MSRIYPGLDVAKRGLDADLLLPEGKGRRRRCAYARSGHQELYIWLARQPLNR